MHSPIYKESQNSPESNEAWCVEFIRNSIGLGVMLLSEYILLIALRNIYLSIMCGVYKEYQ